MISLDDKYIYKYIASKLVLGGDLSTQLRKEIKFPFPQTQ